MEKVISQSRIHLPSNFKIIGVTSTEDVLDKVDIFIYAGTAMCMEALMMGIPVIYVDANKFYNSDPLFECNHLKWTVKHEKDLVVTINKIYDMGDENFKKEQKQSKEYLKDYFSPVNDKGLKEFIER
jgi:predicted glycosyltransferase